MDIESEQKEAEKIFDSKWEAGGIGDWEELRQAAVAENGNREGIWCAACMYIAVIQHIPPIY